MRGPFERLPGDLATLAGSIALKAPAKGADLRRCRDAHDKAQWQKLQSLPDLLYTDGNEFSLWQNGTLASAVVRLQGDLETDGAALRPATGWQGLFGPFLQWHLIAPRSAKDLAEVSARLCRLLRDEVVEARIARCVGVRARSPRFRRRPVRLCCRRCRTPRLHRALSHRSRHSRPAHSADRRRHHVRRDGCPGPPRGVAAHLR
jgi:hypothetical protein